VLEGESVDPLALMEAIAIPDARCRLKGQPGRLAPAPSSDWVLEIPAREAWSTEPVIRELLDRTRERRAVIAKAASLPEVEDAVVVLFIAADSNLPVLELSAESLRGLTELGVGLSVSISFESALL
jgi:hypothetical protein